MKQVLLLEFGYMNASFSYIGSVCVAASHEGKLDIVDLIVVYFFLLVITDLSLS